MFTARYELCRHKHNSVYTFNEGRAGTVGSLANSTFFFSLRNKTNCNCLSLHPLLCLLSVSVISEHVIDRPFCSPAKQRYIFLNLLSRKVIQPASQPAAAALPLTALHTVLFRVILPFIHTISNVLGDVTLESQ
jgi:hypothetical protein